MSDAVKGTCRDCGANVQADRTICKPGMGCRKNRVGTNVVRKGTPLAPVRPSAPAPGSPKAPGDLPRMRDTLPEAPLTPAQVAQCVQADRQDALFGAVQALLDAPGPDTFAQVRDAAKALAFGALGRAIEDHYGPEEARRFETFGRGYRLPHQRQWMRGKRLDYFKSPTFYETEAEYDARLKGGK